jgi:hypothetical protein
VFVWKNSRSVTSSGRVAEWLCSGLQIRVRRFNSDLGLHRKSQAPQRFQPGGAFLLWWLDSTHIRSVSGNLAPIPSKGTSALPAEWLHGTL